MFLRSVNAHRQQRARLDLSVRSELGLGWLPTHTLLVSPTAHVLEEKGRRRRDHRTLRLVNKPQTKHFVLKQIVSLNDENILILQSNQTLLM